MGSWWQRRRLAFRDYLGENDFARFANGAGWWFSGRESEWNSTVLVWRGIDGAVIRYHPRTAVSATYAEVGADEPEEYQRAMAEAEALIRREFRCLALPEALAMLRAAKGEAKAPLLSAVAASVPDSYNAEVAEIVTAALFAPHTSLRAAALRAVVLLEWPDLARPLVAHALTEPEDDLAAFAQSLAWHVYGENFESYLIPAPEETAEEPEGDGTAGKDDEEGESGPQKPAVKSQFTRILAATQGHLDWTP